MGPQDGRSGRREADYLRFLFAYKLECATRNISCQQRNQNYFLIQKIWLNSMNAVTCRGDSRRDGSPFGELRIVSCTRRLWLLRTNVCRGSDTHRSWY